MLVRGTRSTPEVKTTDKYVLAFAEIISFYGHLNHTQSPSYLDIKRPFRRSFYAVSLTKRFSSGVKYFGDKTLRAVLPSKRKEAT